MHFRKLLVTYLMAYLLILVLFVSTLVPLGMRMQQSTRERVFEENQMRLSQGLDDIENFMNKLVQTASMMCVNQDLLRLAVLNESNIDVSIAIYMLRVRMQINYYISLLDDIEYCMLAFGKNPIYLSSSILAQDWQSVYGAFIEYEGKSTEEFRGMMLQEGQSIVCLPEARVKINGQATYPHMLTFLSHGALTASMSKICTFAYLVESKAFLNRIMSGRIEDQGFVIMLNGKGERLAGLGNEPELARLSAAEQEIIEIGQERYVVFREENREMSISLIAGVPEALITANTNILYRFFNGYLVIGILLFLVLCGAYALWHYCSVKQLMTISIQRSGIPYQNTNAYHYVKEALEHISDTKDELIREYSMLDNAYLNNMLISACMHGVYTQKEIDALHKYVGDLSRYCLVVLKYSYETDPIAMLKWEHEIESRLAQQNVLAIHQNPQESILIIAAQGRECDLTALVNEALNRILQGGENGQAGISDVLAGVEMLRLGYQQASYALRAQEFTGGQQGITYYEADENFTILVDIPLLKKLSDLVISGKEDGVHAIFHELEERVRNTVGVTDEQFQEIFYTVRMVLLNIGKELEIECLFPQHNDQQSFQEGLKALEEMARALIAQIEAKYRKGNEELYLRILSVLNQWMGDPSLNATRVAKEVGCSEKYVYRLVKDWSGKNFSEQLESIRIAQTEDYLRNTDMSNEQIAQAVGFASLTTFYRAFRKEHGVTPGVWRSTSSGNGRKVGSYPPDCHF